MCDCILTVNVQLSEHNGMLVTTLFGEPKCVIHTMKVDDKKRGKPPSMLASFCPFCGERYGAAKTAEAA